MTSVTQKRQRKETEDKPLLHLVKFNRDLGALRFPEECGLETLRDMKTHLSLLVDRSGSMHSVLEMACHAAKQVYKFIQPSSCHAVFFNHEVDDMVIDSADELDQFCQLQKPDGSTSFIGAFDCAVPIIKCSGEGYLHIIVFMTDGKDNQDCTAEYIKEQAALIADLPVFFLSCCLGPDSDVRLTSVAKQEFQTIPFNTGRLVYSAENRQEMGAVLEDIARDIAFSVSARSLEARLLTPENTGAEATTPLQFVPNVTREGTELLKALIPSTGEGCWCLVQGDLRQISARLHVKLSDQKAAQTKQTKQTKQGNQTQAAAEEAASKPGRPLVDMTKTASRPAAVGRMITDAFNCLTCTFFNPRGGRHCEVCGSNRNLEQEGQLLATEAQENSTRLSLKTLSLARKSTLLAHASQAAQAKLAGKSAKEADGPVEWKGSQVKLQEIWAKDPAVGALVERVIEDVKVAAGSGLTEEKLAEAIKTARVVLDATEPTKQPNELEGLRQYLREVKEMPGALHCRQGLTERLFRLRKRLIGQHHSWRRILNEAQGVATAAHAVDQLELARWMNGTQDMKFGKRALARATALSCKDFTQALDTIIDILQNNATVEDKSETKEDEEKNEMKQEESECESEVSFLSQEGLLEHLEAARDAKRRLLELVPAAAAAPAASASTATLTSEALEELLVEVSLVGLGGRLSRSEATNANPELIDCSYVSPHLVDTGTLFAASKAGFQVRDPSGHVVEDVIPLAHPLLSAQSNRFLLHSALARAIAATSCTRNPTLAMRGDTHMRALLQAAIGRACLQLLEPEGRSELHVKRLLSLIYTLQILVPRPELVWDMQDMQTHLTEGVSYVERASANLTVTETTKAEEQAKLREAMNAAWAEETGTPEEMAARKKKRAQELRAALQKVRGVQRLKCGSVRLADGSIRFPSGTILQTDLRLKVPLPLADGAPGENYKFKSPLWPITVKGVSPAYQGHSLKGRELARGHRVAPAARAGARRGGRGRGGRGRAQGRAAATRMVNKAVSNSTEGKTAKAAKTALQQCPEDGFGEWRFPDGSRTSADGKCVRVPVSGVPSLLNPLCAVLYSPLAKKLFDLQDKPDAAERLRMFFLALEAEAKARQARKVFPQFKSKKPAKKATKEKNQRTDVGGQAKKERKQRPMVDTPIIIDVSEMGKRGERLDVGPKLRPLRHALQEESKEETLLSRLAPLGEVKSADAHVQFYSTAPVLLFAKVLWESAEDALAGQGEELDMAKLLLDPGFLTFLTARVTAIFTDSQAKSLDGVLKLLAETKSTKGPATTTATTATATAADVDMSSKGDATLLKALQVQAVWARQAGARAALFRLIDRHFGHLPGYGGQQAFVRCLAERPRDMLKLAEQVLHERHAARSKRLAKHCASNQSAQSCLTTASAEPSRPDQLVFAAAHAVSVMPRLFNVEEVRQLNRGEVPATFSPVEVEAWRRALQADQLRTRTAQQAKVAKQFRERREFLIASHRKMLNAVLFPGRKLKSSGKPAGPSPKRHRLGQPKPSPEQSVVQLPPQQLSRLEEMRANHTAQLASLAQEEKLALEKVGEASSKPATMPTLPLVLEQGGWLRHRCVMPTCPEFLQCQATEKDWRNYERGSRLGFFAHLSALQAMHYADMKTPAPNKTLGAGPVLKLLHKQAQRQWGTVTADLACGTTLEEQREQFVAKLLVELHKEVGAEEMKRMGAEDIAERLYTALADNEAGRKVAVKPVTNAKHKKKKSKKSALKKKKKQKSKV